jgi:hypothetical protein
MPGPFWACCQAMVLFPKWLGSYWIPGSWTLRRSYTEAIPGPPPDRRLTGQGTLQKLRAAGQREQPVHAGRWPDGLAGPSCQATPGVQRGGAAMEPARQRSACGPCHQRCEARPAPSVAGPRPPLPIWSVGRSCRGLPGSHAPRAHAWALHGREGLQRPGPRRDGSVKQSPGYALPGGGGQASGKAG